MIASVRGTVAALAPDGAVVEVGGVGLALSCSPGTLARLRVGEDARLATSLVVREDSLTLYGFSDDDERSLFELLQTANGVGPKYLFDQFPESHRTRYAANRGNLFSLSLDLPSEQVEEIAVEGFALPWTGLRWKQGRPYLEAFRSVLQRYYSPNLLDVFNEAAERFAIAPA